MHERNGDDVIEVRTCRHCESFVTPGLRTETTWLHCIPDTWTLCPGNETPFAEHDDA